MTWIFWAVLGTLTAIGLGYLIKYWWYFQQLVYWRRKNEVKDKWDRKFKTNKVHVGYSKPTFEYQRFHCEGRDFDIEDNLRAKPYEFIWLEELEKSVPVYNELARLEKMGYTIFIGKASEEAIDELQAFLTYKVRVKK